jgi:hypothetical protein
MSKRYLSMLIAAALFGAGAGAVQAGERPTPVTSPPPAAAASPTGQTHIPNPLPRADEDEEDEHRATVQTQSPPNDPQLSRRVRSGFEEDGDLAVGRHADPVDYAEQPLADEPFDDEVRVSETATVVMQGEEPVQVRQLESDPFTEAAGSQGFSSGVTAQRAEREFNRLDRDRSGSLSADELEQSALARRFEDYDLNNDGEIAENEFQSWFAAAQPTQRDDTALAADVDEQRDGTSIAADDDDQLDDDMLDGDD